MPRMEPDPHGAFAPGARIGPYVLLERLGAGGMGEVFLARDTRLQRKVALKCLFPSGEGAEGDVARSRILREARAAARINHPNVASIHDVFEDRGRAFIVMEYVEGGSLHDAVAAGALDPRRVIAIGRQLTAAVAAAHAQGVIHRDLKPANIQLTREGSVKVLDFGVAKTSASLLTTATADPETPAPARVGRLAGTPAYMAPEQALGLTVDERADVYGLGVVLFEMATGRRPDPPALFDLAMGVAPHPPRADALNPAVPRALADVIERALQRQPSDRFQSATDLDAALLAIESPGDTHGSRPGVLRRHPIAASIAAVALVVAAAGVVRFVRSSHPIRSIAVLPLVNGSHDPAQDYFADGITDGLISTLGQMTSLSVTARASSMAFKDTTKSMTEIARELDVDALLEGSVTMAAGPGGSERVRVAVDLVDPATQKQIWSTTMDREIGDVLTLQADIARSVAEKISAALSGPGRGAPAGAQAERQVDPEAYRLYLLGRQRWNDRTVPELWKAVDFFGRAIQRDKEYAPAYAGLADSYVLLGGDYGVVPREEAVRQATTNAERALALDPTLAEAHASLAFTSFFLKWDWPAAEQQFRRALELNPSYATAHQWYGNFLSDMGREDEGLAEMRRAQMLDPLSSIISRDVAWPLFFSGRYDAAIQQLQSTLASFPGYRPAERLLARAYAMQGNTQEAVRRFESLQTAEATPRTRFELAWAYALAGRRADALREFDAARAAPGAALYPYDAALVLTALGREEEAILSLNRAFTDRDPTLVNLRHDPRFSSIRGNPGYAKLLALMRFP